MSFRRLAVRWFALCLAVVVLVGGASGVAASQPEPPVVAVQPQSFDCTVVTEIPQSECLALVALWNATQLHPWANHDGWLANATPCDWYGVTCLAGHVSRLEIPKNNMNTGVYGKLPGELGHLIGLEVLDLSDNYFYGPIPAELGQLTSLRELLLRNSGRLTGLPPELGHLMALVRLDLSDNLIGGSLPIELAQLSALEELDLASSGLSGSVPPEFGQLLALRVMNLSANRFTGALPSDFAGLRNLQYLDLSRNYYLSGTLPTAWRELTDVAYLDLSSNQLDGAIPTEWGELANLAYLNLSGNQLDGTIPAEWARLANLSELDLSANQLVGPIPAALGDLAALTRLNLAGNPLGGEIPAELGKLENLRFLSLRVAQLEGAIPSQLGNLTLLEDLWLDYNQLSGSIPPELGNLNIRSGWYYPVRPDSLQRPIPPHGYLLLGSNRLSGPVPAELGRLEYAAGIDLSCNQLSGDLPSEVGLLIGHTYWGTIWYNKLTGFDPQLYPDQRWDLSQTVPPTGMGVITASNALTLTWTPITYTTDGGFYEISYAAQPEGPFAVHGRTADKAASSYEMADLASGGTYYFRVRTFTPAHANEWCYQQNDLWSDYTPEVCVNCGPPSGRVFLPLVGT